MKLKSTKYVERKSFKIEYTKEYFEKLFNIIISDVKWNRLCQINFSNNDTEQGKSLKTQFDTYDTNLASMLRVLKQKTPERSNINVTY